MISVIIPAYNCALYLRKAVDSVLQQSCSDFEIIVVDDGSTDNTHEIIKTYSNRDIRYFYQKNQGASAARNFGLQQAQGEFIAFLDADDIWFPDKLNKQLQVFLQNPECIGVFSDFYIKKSNEEIISKQGLKQEYGIFKYQHYSLDTLFESRQGSVLTGRLFNSLFLGNFIKTSSFVIRKRVLDECGYFNPELITQEDYDLWLRLAVKGLFSYIDEPLLSHTKRDGQLTSDENKLRIAIDVVQVVESYKDSSHLKLPPSLVKNRLWQINRNLCLNYLRTGEKSKARAVLRKSLKYCEWPWSILMLLVWSLMPDRLSFLIREHFLPIIRSRK